MIFGYFSVAVFVWIAAALCVRYMLRLSERKHEAWVSGGRGVEPVTFDNLEERGCYVIAGLVSVLWCVVLPIAAIVGAIYGLWWFTSRKLFPKIDRLVDRSFGEDGK